MKTKEEIKQEVINYLTKSSKHTFAYDDGKLFKVVKIEDDFYRVDEKSWSKNEIFQKINLGLIETQYGINKCFFKQMLFLNKNLKSVRTNRFNREQIESYFPAKKQVA